jgi:hypothetical protein
VKLYKWDGNDFSQPVAIPHVNRLYAGAYWCETDLGCDDVVRNIRFECNYFKKYKF